MCKDASIPGLSLRDVLEYTLTKHRDSLAEGTFPSERFAEHFKHHNARELSAFVEQDIEAFDQATAARRKVLLTFWDNAPPTLGDLHLSIHDAFDISFSGKTSRKTSNGQPPRPPEPPPPIPPLGTILDRDLQDFAKWRKGESLPQRLERRLRGLVHGSVVAHMDWERLVPTPADWIGGPKAFSTNRVFFRDQRQEHPRFIYLPIDRRSTTDAAAIEALLRYEHHGDWSFKNGTRSFRSFRIALDTWAAHVRTQLETIRETDRVAFENAVHALVVGAIVCGLVDARHSSAVELTDAVFAQGLKAPIDANGPLGGT